MAELTFVARLTLSYQSPFAGGCIYQKTLDIMRHLNHFLTNPCCFGLGERQRLFIINHPARFANTFIKGRTQKSP
jgi:hypothetical protein